MTKYVSHIYIWSLSIVPPYSSWNFLREGSHIVIFDYVNEVAFRPHLGIKLVARRTNQSEVGTFSPSFWPPGEREGLVDESIASGQGFNQSWLCNKASIETQRASGLVNTGDSGRVVHLARTWTFHALSPYLALCISYLAFCSKPTIQQVKRFSEFCESFQHIKPKRGEAYGNLWFISSGTSTNLDLLLVSEEEWESCRTLNLCNLMLISR